MKTELTTRPQRTRRGSGTSFDGLVIVAFVPMMEVRTRVRQLGQIGIEAEADALRRSLRLETTEASHGCHG